MTKLGVEALRSWDEIVSLRKQRDYTFGWMALRKA
jgi:hypothetical protein